MLDPTVAEALRDAVAEREWSQFHTPSQPGQEHRHRGRRAARVLSVGRVAAPTDRVAEELADVLTYCQLLADRLGLNTDSIVLDKLAKTEAKYPVDRARGRSARYDQLPD